jgi:small-conductance mechanosensitive channel
MVTRAFTPRRRLIRLVGLAMMEKLTYYLDTQPWLGPAVYVLAGLLFGLFVDKVLLERLRAMVSRTRSQVDDVVVRHLHGSTAFWFFIAGVYVALGQLPIELSVLVSLRRLLLVIIILSATIVVARIAAELVGLYAAQSEGLIPSTSIFRNITAVVVVALGILVTLQTLGISITPILGALGVGGLAVALALQDTLSNLFAGLHIIASRQVRVGDFIRLETGEEGYVTDIRWRNTTIRALQNNMVIIPNSKLASTIMTNYYQPDKELAVLVQMGVHYESDLAKVERVTIEVAREVMQTVEGGIPSFEPFTRYHTFADSSINFSVVMRGREFADQHVIRHEFIKRVQKRYAQEGIEIPFPIRNVYMRSAVELQQRPSSEER